jgi:PAS domain S-box-containing protein
MKIQTRIIGAVILVIAIATAVFGVYLYRTERANSLARLRNVMAEDERLLAVVTAGPLYDGNVEQLSATFDSFFSNPDMVRIDLMEYRGNIRITRTRNPIAALGETFSNRIVVKRGIDELGEVTVAYSTARIEQSLTVLRNQVLLYSGTLVLVLSIIISLVVRGLTRPIGRFTEAARDMASGHLDREIDSRGAEELQSLGQSFIRMRDAIREKMTDLAARNEALRISEDRLRSVVENTPVVLFALDLEGRFTLSEGKGLAVLGLQPGQVVGQSALEIYRDFPSVVAGLRRALAGEEFSLVTEISGLIFEVWYSPLRNAAGELIGTIGVGTDITERKRAENELRNAHELLRGVINATQDLIFVKDTNLTYIICNKALADFIGRPEDQIVGQTDATLFPDLQLSESFQSWDRKVLAEGRQYYIEEWVTSPDGRQVPFETLKSPFYSDGRLLGLIGISRDITERKRVSEALRESEERLRQVVRASQIGIFDHDHLTDTIYWSPEQRVYYGWGPDEPVTLAGFIDRIHPDDRERIAAAVRRAHDPAGDGLYDVEHRIIRRDGEVRWLITRSQTFFEGEGAARRPVRTVGGVIDITERKRVEESLRQASLIVENSPVMLFRWQAADGWPIVLVSQNVVQLGYSPEELLDGSVLFASMVHPDDLERVGQEVQSYTASGTDRFQQEYRIITKDGQVRWLEDRTMVERDDAGRVTHYQGIVVDITERRRADAERERLIGELEMRNAELERFTYTVSHDLKSPLITMRGFLGYLEKDALTCNTQRMKADIARISDATDKMDRLLRELLELSRIGRVMNPPDQVSFEEIAREAVGLVAGQLKERGIRVEIATGMPVVFGDRVRLVEVVQNLVDNAAKFTGGQAVPFIEIGAREEERNSKPVFFVRDNGIGIELRYQEKIFGLFDKLDPASEGTGIGLALVKRIIEVHGGTIWVESEGPDRGSTFCFTLPPAQTTAKSGG